MPSSRIAAQPTALALRLALRHPTLSPPSPQIPAASPSRSPWRTLRAPLRATPDDSTSHSSFSTTDRCKSLAQDPAQVTRDSTKSVRLLECKTSAPISRTLPPQPEDTGPPATTRDEWHPYLPHPSIPPQPEPTAAHHRTCPLSTSSHPPPVLPARPAYRSHRLPASADPALLRIRPGRTSNQAVAPHAPRYPQAPRTSRPARSRLQPPHRNALHNPLGGRPERLQAPTRTSRPNRPTHWTSHQAHQPLPGMPS